MRKEARDENSKENCDFFFKGFLLRNGPLIGVGGESQLYLLKTYAALGITLPLVCQEIYFDSE